MWLVHDLATMKVMQWLKEGKWLFMLLLELQKLIFGLPKSTWHKWLPLISAVECQAAHLCWISVIDREWTQRSSEGWTLLPPLQKTFTNMETNFVWAYGTGNNPFPRFDGKCHLKLKAPSFRRHEHKWVSKIFYSGEKWWLFHGEWDVVVMNMYRKEDRSFLGQVFSREP